MAYYSQVDRRDLLALIDKPGAALLEGWSEDGRWRIALPDPVEEFRAGWGEEARVEDFLRRIAVEREPPGGSAAAPFASGWVGFLSYELGAVWEGAEPRPEHPEEPAALFYRHESGIAVREEDPPADRGRPAPDERGAPPGLEDSLAGDAYRDAHERIRDGIARGDFYQVNLTRRFRAAPAAGTDPRELYLGLTGGSPPPYALLLRGGDVDVLSASPELFLRADFRTRRVEMRPIKGTSPRFPDPRRDRESAERVRRSPKDRAENVMIVDLCRNDLGKVCETGSVRVPALCRVRSHRVHHLESTVTGRLRPGVSPLELLRATFPPGSVTGAPKRAAVAAIRRLEPVARGVYTGAAGFFDRRGSLALNVAIRTGIASRSQLRYHAGGGIVWDSASDAERAEGDLKAAEFFSLLGANGGECAR